MPAKSARKRKSKRNQLAVVVLAIIALLFVISWGLSFINSLFSPWNLPETKKKYTWNGEFNINLLVRAKHLSLLTFSPKDKKIVIINIPDETFLEVPHGFGKWQLRSIFELGLQQPGIGGHQLLKDTLTSFLAMPIDGFLDVNALLVEKSAVDVVESLRKNPFGGLGLLSSLKTDLTTVELIRLKLGISSVRFDKISEVSLNELDALDKENLLDGTAVLTADPIHLDSVLSDLADPQIVSEHKSIAVFNGTSQPQLAGKWARLITNLGGNVIITANADRKIKETQVTGEPSLTLTRLKQIFELGCQNNPKCDKINRSEAESISQRAEINVFLGEDYIDR